MKLYNIAKWLEYKMLSRHNRGHGIHSPFVFDLVTRVFRNKTDADFVCSIEEIRRDMISCKRVIHVKDLGSGSGRMKNNERSVSEIARYSPVPRKYGVLLAGLAREFGMPSIIEFGTSLGISTMYMASASPASKVITIEGCPETSKIAKENFLKAGLDNISIITGAFDEVIYDYKGVFKEAGMIFIDGNHRKQPMLDYFNILSEISGQNTVIALDDIYYSKETASAWEEIKCNKKVTVSIDLFRMGLIFFRKGMPRSDYIISY
jgi:predicted O-methyltransferase YrrM